MIPLQTRSHTLAIPRYIISRIPKVWRKATHRIVNGILPTGLSVRNIEAIIKKRGHVSVYGNIQIGVHRFLKRFDPEKVKLLDIGSFNRRIHPRALNIDLIAEPDTDIIHDIQKPLPFRSGTFDAVVCTAVLEHISSPISLVAEIHRVLRSGGEVWADVPFLQPYHAVPHDYQRYTLSGFRYLFRNFEEVDAGNGNGIGSAMAWLLDEYRKVVLEHTKDPILREWFDIRWEEFKNALNHLDTDTTVNSDPMALSVTGAVYFHGRK